MFRKLSSKLILIFLLIILAFTSTVITSYFLLDTQNQNLILTDILSEQIMLVERITSKALILSEIKRLEYNEFEKKYKLEKVTMNKYRIRIDDLLEILKKRKFEKNGGEIRNKFVKEFAINFDKILDSTIDEWRETKKLLDILLEESIGKVDKYNEKLNELKNINTKLIERSDYILKICKEEAERRKKSNNIFQILNIITSSVIFIFLINLVINGFYRPIIKIKNTLFKMGEGNFDQHLVRCEDDEFKEIYKSFNNFNENLNIIIELEKQILVEEDFENMLKFIENKFKNVFQFSHMGIIFLNSENLLEKRILIEGKFIVVESRNKELKRYNKVERDEEIIVVPININEVYLGYIYFQFEEGFEFKEREINFLKLMETKLSLAFYKGILVKDLLLIITNSLAKMIEAKDFEIGDHVKIMTIYSKIVAEKLLEKGLYPEELDEKFIENLKRSAPMHDIGKVFIADNILLKPEKLTDEEFNRIKTHTNEGGIVLEKLHKKFLKYNIDYFRMATEIAYSHQEKFDGTGYPRSIKGENIPLSARIIAICDVFDVLTSKRPYKDAFSLAKSYEIIKELRGSHFDPDIVDAFFEARERIEGIYNKYKGL